VRIGKRREDVKAAPGIGRPSTAGDADQGMKAVGVSPMARDVVPAVRVVRGAARQDFGDHPLDGMEVNGWPQ